MSGVAEYKALLIDHLIARAEGREADEDRLLDRLDFDVWRNLDEASRDAVNEWTSEISRRHLNADGSVRDLAALEAERP